ncbi:fungal zn(2)-Cys(6) binuclear cluster domain-containing protein [Cordyceps javanica]|nr:fungal zn(2)-Cys(6) binuclear cluster domain-containing protein [Cordyceps javanica]
MEIPPRCRAHHNRLTKRAPRYIAKAACILRSSTSPWTRYRTPGPTVYSRMDVLRDACDSCHRRKTRCISRGRGACANCWDGGQVCIYSPRNPMGRPSRQQGRKRRQEKLISPSNSQQDLSLPAVTTAAQKTVISQPEELQHSRHENVFESATMEPTDGSGDDSILLLTGKNNEPSYLSPMTDKTEPTQNGSVTPAEASMNSYLYKRIRFPDITGFMDGDRSINTAPTQPKEVHGREDHTSELMFDPQLLINTSEGTYTPESLLLTTSDTNRCDQDELIEQHMPATFSTRLFRSQTITPPLVECYSQLSQILFRLHAYRQELTENGVVDTGGAEQDSRPHQVFSTVGTFCDLVLPVFRDTHSFVEEPGYSCFLLAVSVTNSIVDIYQLLLQHHRNAWSLRPPSPSPGSLREPSYGVEWRSQQDCLGTQPLLSMILDARTMDFHLQQLERLFYSITMLEGAPQAQSKITNLRGALQKWTDELQIIQ